VGKVRTGLLLLGHSAAGPLAAGHGLSDELFVAAWIVLGLGLVGHWIAAYNYFWAILRKGRRLHDDGGTT
jgi:cardiolipin synthase